MTTLSIRTPDDWHLHLRDGAVMAAVAPLSAAFFGRAIIMPNLVPPVVTTADAVAYRDRILAALPKGWSFTPLMTLYLTEATEADDVERGFRSGDVVAVKLYPAGATTNSDNGVRDMDRVMPVLERMASIGMPLLVHGEVTDPAVDIFDREAVFIDRVLAPLRQRLPGLKVVMEHITTSEGVAYVQAGPIGQLAGTITPHHLMINRNALLVGGIKPHFYCLPIAKRESHRVALCEAATSGDAHFFLGTDSAPHVDPKKECACGCAGIFSATNALSCVAEVFEEEGALDRFEAFVSLNGPAFYGLEPNRGHVTLERRDEGIAFAKKIHTGDGPVTVFAPGRPLHWTVSGPRD